MICSDRLDSGFLLYIIFPVWDFDGVQILNVYMIGSFFCFFFIHNSHHVDWTCFRVKMSLPLCTCKNYVYQVGVVISWDVNYDDLYLFIAVIAKLQLSRIIFFFTKSYSIFNVSFTLFVINLFIINTIFSLIIWSIVTVYILVNFFCGMITAKIMLLGSSAVVCAF